MRGRVQNRVEHPHCHVQEVRKVRGLDRQGAAAADHVVHALLQQSERADADLVPPVALLKG